MKVTLEATTKIVEVQINGQTVPARIWEGTTAGGILCHAYVTRIAIADPTADTTEFDRELREVAVPSPAIAAIPARLVW